MEMKKVYIAAPYTNPDPCENTHFVVTVANKLWDNGFIPFVPHLNLLWHLITPKPVDEWYKWDMYWLESCDIVLRVGGDSWGADQEVKRAKKLHIPVFYSLEELLRNEK